MLAPAPHHPPKREPDGRLAPLPKTFAEQRRELPSVKPNRYGVYGAYGDGWKRRPQPNATTDPWWLEVLPEAHPQRRLPWTPSSSNFSAVPSIHPGLDYRDAFTLLDTDRSGSIDVQELCAAIAKGTGSAISPERVKRLIRDVDANGDGVLQLDEFKQLWHQFSSTAGQQFL